MLQSVSNRNSVVACFADCPTDNHARPLAQFLYETLCLMQNLKNQMIELFGIK